MHYDAYVLVSEVNVNSSLEARKEVKNTLLNDSSFVGEGGRFSRPVCDRFAIGGRWSGTLYPFQLCAEFFRQANLLLSEKDQGWNYTDQFIQENRNRLEMIWQKLGGKYASPLTRNQPDELGEDDDAHLLDEPLAKRLNSFLYSDEYSNSQEYYIACKEEWFRPVVLSLDSQALVSLSDFNDLVGKYWVVVIDYHK